MKESTELNQQETEKNELVKMLKDSFLKNKEAAQKNIIRSFENFCVQNGYQVIFFTKDKYIAQTEGNQREPIGEDDILNMFLGVAANVLDFAQSYFPNISVEEFKAEIFSVIQSIIQSVVNEHGTFVFRYDIDKPKFLNRKGEVVNLVNYLSLELEKIQ